MAFSRVRYSVQPLLSTTMLPTASEIRTPSRKRAKMSRPTLSVPIGCDHDGACSEPPTLIASGSFGHATGPISASRTSSAKTPTATSIVASRARKVSARPAPRRARTNASPPSLSAEPTGASIYSSNACG